MDNQRYIQEALKNLKQFEEHLISYHKEKDTDKKKYLEGTLDDILAVLEANIKEIPRKEMHKDMHVILKGYKKFKQSQNNDDYAALGQDLRTVKQILQEINS